MNLLVILTSLILGNTTTNTDLKVKIENPEPIGIPEQNWEQDSGEVNFHDKWQPNEAKYDNYHQTDEDEYKRMKIFTDNFMQRENENNNTFSEFEMPEEFSGETIVGLKGTGKTTRYWDCCKPSCAWKENVGTLNPVASCAKNGINKVQPSAKSGCENGGSAYSCNNFQPWKVSDTLSYGFVAASFHGGVDNKKCCVCLKFTFINALKGKTMIVQNVNTGGDLQSNHFDIQIPGGGVGIFNLGCHSQWNAPWSGWGPRYGGVKSPAECNQLPNELRSGCHWRFGWFENADNPHVNFEQVTCPNELTSKSGCVNNHIY